MPLLDILTKTGLAPASTGLQRIGELLSKCSQQQSFQSLRSLISRISETKLLPNSLAMLNTLSVPLAAMVCFAIVFKLRVFISSILRATRRVSSSSRASPKDIVQRIHVDHNRLKKLEIELESRDKVIQKLRSQLEGERATITRQQNTISTINGQHKSINAQVRKVEQRNRDQGKHITALNAQISTLQASIAGQRNTAAQLSSAIVQSNNREIDAKNRERIAIQELHEVRKQNTEMQFDLELLRCTASQSSVVSHETASDLQAFALPFVMVIVDGDAYSWSNDHFNQERIPAGAHAAQAIKANVQQYLLSNDNRLPLTCKIVTRVYQNAGWALRNNTARGLASRQGRVQEFPLHFTESMPLFDYVDCGNGKERADSKIQELVHLFIANPRCYTIFLAATTDNGFARLLEQYMTCDALKQKIVLVHPGYLATEIERLKYDSVEWRDVFQRREPPPEMLSKARHEHNQRKEAEKHNKRLGERAVVDFLAPGISSYWGSQRAEIGLPRNALFKNQLRLNY